MELEKKMEQVTGLFENFKKENDQRLKEIEKKGAADTLLTEKVEKMNDAISALEDQVKATQTAMNRKEVVAEQKDSQEYKVAFEKWMRKGVEDVKALSVNSDPDGGYLVRPELSSEIVKKVFESSPVRQLASVQSISTDQFEVVCDLDEADAEWVAEAASRSDTGTPQINKLIIPAHEMHASPKATQKMLDDGYINVEAWLAEHVGMKFGRLEATAFISGDGVNKPKGLLSYTAGTAFNQVEQINSGSSGVFTADGLIDMVYGVKAEYRMNASWLFARAGIKAVRKLKDSQNQYLWAPGLNGNTQGQLLGFAVYEAADMQAIAADSLSAIFGDIRAAYQIVDRVGVRVLRDPFSAKPYVVFYTTKRVGGGVKNFEAYKIQKLAA